MTKTKRKCLRKVELDIKENNLKIAIPSFANFGDKFYQTLAEKQNDVSSKNCSYTLS